MQGGESNANQGSLFRTTHWSVIFDAGKGNALQSADALEKLCRAYWYPIYSHVRKRGLDHCAAEDLTQSFFGYFLDKQFVEIADPEKGMFRSFLLKLLNNFLNNEWRKSRAEKRGDGVPTISIDSSEAEDRFALEPVDRVSPDQLFDRNFALALLEQVFNQLQEEYRSKNLGRQFERLRSFLQYEQDAPSYAQVAAELNMSEAAVKSFIHRMRLSFNELYRNTVAEIVPGEDDVDEEVRYLLSVLVD